MVFNKAECCILRYRYTMYNLGVRLIIFNGRQYIKSGADSE